MCVCVCVCVCVCTQPLFVLFTAAFMSITIKKAAYFCVAMAKFVTRKRHNVSQNAYCFFFFNAVSKQ